jgi:hypothetical protein
MERRFCKRKKVHIEGEIILDDSSCNCVIGNISEKGVYVETASSNLLSTSTGFTSGTKLKVKFQTQNETINIDCRVMWSFKVAPLGLTKQIGMEVVFPPPSYVEFYKAMLNSADIIENKS